jgi:hypothetical protein
MVYYNDFRLKLFKNIFIVVQFKYAGNIGCVERRGIEINILENKLNVRG